MQGSRYVNLCFFCRFIYTYFFAFLVISFKFNISVYLSKKCIISANSYIISRMEFSSSLSYKNTSCTYIFSCTYFQSKLAPGCITAFRRRTFLLLPGCRMPKQLKLRLPPCVRKAIVWPVA